MNIVLYTKDASIRGSCITQLLFLGFSVFSSDKFEKINAFLTKDNVDCLIVDIDDEEINWIEFINKLKESKKHEFLFVVLITSQKNNILNSIIMDCSINAVLYKTNSFNDSIQKMTPSFINHKKFKSKRKHIRISPDVEDEISAVININGLTSINSLQAKVKDLSPISIAIGFEDKEHLKYINEKNCYINTLKINIGNDTYSCDGFVVRKNCEFIAIKYINTNSIFRSGIAEYISRKISH
jgi:response regulator RpfG family c-di-GMP phosphodiesterase